MIIHNFEQHSDDWYNIRLGKFTASKASVIHTAGTGLETYCFDIVAEILTKKKKDTFQSQAMQQGNELEDVARTLFEMETGYEVEQVGFIEIDRFSGCSPDGLIINRSSGIEIKCPQDNTFAKYLYDDNVKPEHYAQMQMNMLFCECDKWFYMVYNPHFENSFIIREIKADKEFQQKLVAGLNKGKDRVIEILTKIETPNQDDVDFWNSFLKSEIKRDYRV